MAGWLVKAACVLWLLRVSRFSGIVSWKGQRADGVWAARRRLQGSQRPETRRGCRVPLGRRVSISQISVWYLIPRCLRRGRAKPFVASFGAQRDVRAPEPSLETHRS